MSTLGEDMPDASDFPRAWPSHNCWRNGGVDCARCELEEMREEALLVFDSFGVGVGPAT